MRGCFAAAGGVVRFWNGAFAILGEREEKLRKAGKPQLWSLPFVLILAATFACFVTGQGLNTGTSLYIERVGGPASYAGVLALVFSVAAASTRLFFGQYIDRFRKTRIAAVGMAVLAVSTAMPLMVNDLGLPFAATRALQGAAFALATTSCAAAAAEVLPPDRLGEGIGYHGLGQAVAMSIGPAFALFLVSTDPASNLYAGLSAVGLLAFLVILLCRYEKHPRSLPAESTYRRRWEASQQECAAAQEKRERIGTDSASSAGLAAQEANSSGESSAADLRDPASLRGVRRWIELRALPGALPVLFLSAAFGFVIFFAGLYGERVGVSNPSILYSVSAVTMILVRLSSGMYMDTKPPKVMYALAVASAMVCFALMQVSVASPFAFYLAGAFYGVAIGIGFPLCQSVCIKSVPETRWGAASALYLLVYDIGIGTGSAVWGIAGEALGFEFTLWIVQAICAASLACAFVTFPSHGPRP